MGPLAIRRLTCRLRRHATGLLLVLALGGAIAAHHSGIGMGAMHHDGMSTAIELCLAVFTAVGASIAAAAVGLVALGRWATAIELVPTAAYVLARTQAPAARAGPPPLSLLCVWRR